MRPVSNRERERGKENRKAVCHLLNVCSLAHFVFSFPPSPTRAHYVALSWKSLCWLPVSASWVHSLFLKYTRSHISSCGIIEDFLIVTCSSADEKTVLLILEAVTYRRKWGDGDTHTKYQFCVVLSYKEKNLALIWYFCFFRERSRNLGCGFNNSLLNMYV